MSNSSAARTNLTSNSVTIYEHNCIGEGAFRLAYSGTYVGGNRNKQEAVCKAFKPRYCMLENEFFRSDMKVVDRAISFCEDWNGMCEHGKEILMTRGSVMEKNGKKYLVEPLIRHFTKFTSNNGWIADSADLGWEVEAMEAFCHYTYHRSGGSMIVCDLQGRYRYNRYSKTKSRFELTDPAICSRQRLYGPTDMGEKGIESFFNEHVCNRFCNVDERWQRPRFTQQWFPLSSGTSMLSSSQNVALSMNHRTAFQPGFMNIMEESDSDDY